MRSAPHPRAIRLRGVRQNNLKGFDLDLPLGKLIVVTGLSGSGKSSLVFDTLYAEGQRRYVETFSPYARQFMDRLERPHVDRIDDIRPAIAIAQGNTVRTSRSTVGTMTEICDYAKVWFCHAARLHDPATGLPLIEGHPQSIWREARAAQAGKTVLVTFPLAQPERLPWEEIRQPLLAQGYRRVVADGVIHEVERLAAAEVAGKALLVVQDRLRMEDAERARFLEAAGQALHFGQGEMRLVSESGQILSTYVEGLRSPVTGQRFRPAQPNLFSFNSPVGACPECRGFGRVIRLDERLAMPDHRLSIAQGVVRAFQGAVYSESQKDLLRACRQAGIPVNVPWRELSPEHQQYVLDGDPDFRPHDWPNGGWYGVRGFFKWLEGNTYKMHVRVFLSRFRAYVPCPACGGARLQPEALNWKWRGHTLPELYQMPVSDLLAVVREHGDPAAERGPALAFEAMRTRLSYLDQVGLGYLTLDRASRTLSGGESQRVSLTSCLGTSLVDTLFVLDEPSIGLHPRDIHRLISALRMLTDQGNTVVVVEHDESVMRAADLLLEIGPKPGAGGGQVTFFGTLAELARREDSLTGAYLSGAKSLPLPRDRRHVDTATPRLRIRGAQKHNLRDLSLDLPLGRLVVLSGVSGSGKSTLLDNVIYQGLLSRSGQATEDPATIESIESDRGFSEVVFVDQSAVSRTPRSNPAVFVGAWDDIRRLLATTPEAKAAGLTASSFSFNAGSGRCPHCEGLGFEKVEMQFMADLYVTCPVCEGRRFQPDVLALTYDGKSIDEILHLTIDEARLFFAQQPRLLRRLEALGEVGLGYLQLGQPLNTLSGGEAQRLKLVKYLNRFGEKTHNALLLLDEPTTGLHRDDVGRLLAVLHRLVDEGHTLFVIEHHLDVLRHADWLVELGPEAGVGGGRLVFAGTPEALARTPDTATSPFLAEAVAERQWIAAEAPAAYNVSAPAAIRVEGAREHNLKNLTVEIPHHAITVVTGVSGSGKSTLAFDLIFAEGQRRFMESMSAWARQYVEQLPRPELDHLSGIPPAVAIEQRVTRGTAKSTVATITEVAQYLRLLYARVGVQHSPVTGQPLVSMEPAGLAKRLGRSLEGWRDRGHHLLYLCAPLVRGRKGHHEPLAKWAREHGYPLLRADGVLVPVEGFQGLDRYREHDVEVVVCTLRWDGRGWQAEGPEGPEALAEALKRALDVGKKVTFVADAGGANLGWFSTERTDPATGEAYPPLDPKNFSWNSPRGWCPRCTGEGYLSAEPEAEVNEDVPPAGEVCPECHGTRLNAVSRAVYLHLTEGDPINLPALLAMPAPLVLETLGNVASDARGMAVVRNLRPEIEERLRFLGLIGLDYLSLDRPTNSLSGGEAQRIRLAAQLGGNLSGVLYVLDEPSVGLHARDNDRLLQSLRELRDKGNTLLIVEHDLETMRVADRLIDLGPGAGRHGGEILAQGTVDEVAASPASLTAQYLRHGVQHPRRGSYRPLPPYPTPKARRDTGWLILEEPRLRNLRGGRLCLPRGRYVSICGVSGAGKSTLVRDVLKPAIEAAIRADADVLDGDLLGGTFRKLRFGNKFRRVVEVDQAPIGKTPRSTPATYLGAFDLIRQQFGQLPEARMRGFTAGTFSFNTPGGRCETCKGAGRIKLEMSFMPDTFVPCDDCGGSRYGPQVTDIRWQGKNIAEVLHMTFAEAAAFFSFHSRLREMLRLMEETGLGYLTLGQSSPTLSGGEAQRLKLVSELAAAAPSPRERLDGPPPSALYILEEPTLGLHLADCERLIDLLHRLVDLGNTVVLIEHHADLLAEADYIVELGPEGGLNGGEILFQGAVADLAARPGSPTGPHLAAALAPPTAT